MFAFVEAGEVTLAMALLDTIPVVLFMVGMGYVIRMAYGRLSPVHMALLTGGAFVGFFGGFFKCIWKLIVIFGEVDYVAFDRPFSVYQGVGFCMIACALVAFAVGDKRGFAIDKKPLKTLALSLPLVALALVQVAPSFVWFAVMCVGTLVYLSCLAACAFRRKMIFEGILFMLSAVGMIIMGAMGSKFKAGAEWASLNWLAEILNTLVQLAMCYPAIKLSQKYTHYKTEYVNAA